MDTEDIAAAVAPALVRALVPAPEAAEQGVVRRLAARSRRIRKNDVCPRANDVVFANDVATLMILLR